MVLQNAWELLCPDEKLLTRKRVLKNPAFQLTRVHAALLGEASKIASRVYRLITGERKKYALYREITGKAIYLLREGKDKEEVFEILSRQKGKFKSEIPVPDLKKLYPGTGRSLSPARRKKILSRSLMVWRTEEPMGP